MKPNTNDGYDFLSAESLQRQRENAMRSLLEILEEMDALNGMNYDSVNAHAFNELIAEARKVVFSIAGATTRSPRQAEGPTSEP